MKTLRTFGLIERATVLAVVLSVLALATGCAPAGFHYAPSGAGMSQASARTYGRDFGGGGGGNVLVPDTPRDQWTAADSRVVAVLTVATWAGLMAAHGGWQR